MCKRGFQSSCISTSIERKYLSCERLRNTLVIQIPPIKLICVKLEENQSRKALQTFAPHSGVSRNIGRRVFRSRQSTNICGSRPRTGKTTPIFYCALQGTILIFKEQSQRYQFYQYHAFISIS